MKHTKGFTLIELLVVISIIGVLSTLIFTSIQEARFKAQITKTISDLTTIEKAFQMMIISEDMDCWPREGGNQIDSTCSISLIAENAPSSPNNANVMSVTIADALASNTSPLNQYLSRAPQSPFSGFVYGYDNDNNITFNPGPPCTGHSASSPYSGVNLTLRRGGQYELTRKIFDALDARLDRGQEGHYIRCGKVRFYDSSTNPMIYYSLANYRNQIDF